MITNQKGIDYMSKCNTENEIWEDVVNYEGIYEVSNRGRVRSVDRVVITKNGRECKYKGKMISMPPNQDGYPTFNLCYQGKIKPVKTHRIVAEAFIPNPNNYTEINHIDENKANNEVSNLEWCTRKHNMNHGTGLQRSFNHPNSVRRIEKSKRPVTGINLKTDECVYYESAHKAEEYGFKRKNVQGAACGKDASYKGYIWFYTDEMTEKLVQEKRDRLNRNVLKLDDNNQILNVFSSMTEAGRAVGLDPSNISRAISTGRKASGFYWKKQQDI